MNSKKLHDMKNIYLLFIAFIFSMYGFTSCVDLDITPKNVLTGEDIYSEVGIKAYMSGMYNHLPMEDFHYDVQANNVNTQSGYFSDLNVWTYWNSTGEMQNRNNDVIKLHRTGYWSEGFKIIRQANTLINDLPNYPALATQAKNWIGEAKFLRAYVYFQLVKRYGGLPIIEAPQNLNADDISTLWTPRSSHADTYDFILADLDAAIDGMNTTSEAGRANKYVAAALKSRVALHAATTARYGSMKFQDWNVDGVLLQGILSDKANDYFKQAWDAAKLVEGHYELHNANGDKTANYAEIWEKAESNKESIWLRKYSFGSIVHSYDAVMVPPRMATTYGDRFNPTLDWVELFDGLPISPATGHFSAFDADGNYLVYDNCHQLWDGVEPRLRANLLLPGQILKEGFKVDLRSGIFNKDINPAVRKFKKFSIDDGANEGSYLSTEGQVPEKYLFRDGIILNSTADPKVQNDLYEVDGMWIYKNGLDGPKLSNNGSASTLTGFHGRKHINVNMPLWQTALFQSTQPWIEIRYAEVVLNRAEAAVVLAQSGVTNYNGTDMLTDAFTCINNIRSRAGANLLIGPGDVAGEAYTNWTKPGPKGQGGFVEAPTRALQIVRVERYKELAFESKIYWDLMRWFTFDTQINQYCKRGLFSFMFSKGATVGADGIPDGKYIYDAKNVDNAAQSKIITFSINNYYEVIPGEELVKNPMLQKNRNQ
jgi:hypothetical protein